jgi:hypothetical protein
MITPPATVNSMLPFRTAPALPMSLGAFRAERCLDSKSASSGGKGQLRSESFSSEQKQELPFTMP